MAVSVMLFEGFGFGGAGGAGEGVGAGLPVGGGVGAGGDGGFALALAVGVDEGVGEDLVQPGAQVGAGGVLGEGGVGLGQGVLDQVLGVGGVAGHPQRGGVELAEVGPDLLLEVGLPPARPGRGRRGGGSRGGSRGGRGGSRWSRWSSAVAPSWSVTTKTPLALIRIRDLSYTPATHSHQHSLRPRDAPDTSGTSAQTVRFIGKRQESRRDRLPGGEEDRDRMSVIRRPARTGLPP